jgi:carbonic anhydrase
MPLLDELLAANAAFASTRPADQAPSRPALGLAIVTCMDARIDVERMLGLRAGDAHILRNAGGVVTDDVIRSLVISQRLLGTRAILLVHHTDCGMLTFRDDDLRREIEREVGIRPPFAFDAFPDLVADLHQSVRRLAASPFLPHKDEIAALIYDVHTGRLTRVV